MQHSPAVRLVIVNWNRRDFTLACLDSVASLDWPGDALDVVVVDNGSTDGSAEAIRRAHPKVRIVETGENLGFAAGCNAAMSSLDGVDHVALLNNDAQVDPAWLRELVGAFDRHERLGAATSKVLFAEPFVRVEIATTTHRAANRDLGVRISAARVGGLDRLHDVQLGAGWWGVEHARGQTFSWSRGTAELFLPGGEKGGLPGVDFELEMAGRPGQLVTVDAGEPVEVEVGTEPRLFRFRSTRAGVDLIDNAGGLIGSDLYGRDRGHLLPAAQLDEEQEVFAWYGGAALLSAEYLRDVGLFDERLFMYYEDLDLAWRGRARGWRYVFVPTAVVRHAHSASAVEGSPFAEYHGERNRLLVLARNASATDASRAAARFVLSTASYARRDLFRREGRSGEKVRRRVSAFGGFVRRLPGFLLSRRGARRLPTAELRRWLDG